MRYHDKITDYVRDEIRLKSKCWWTQLDSKIMCVTLWQPFMIRHEH